MRFNRLVYVVFFWSVGFHLSSQDFLSYGNSNYGGAAQVISNPAAAATNKVKLDILFAGFDVTFNNSWVGVKRDALAFPKLPGSWKNFTPNIEGNVYKNFDWHSNAENKEVLFEQRVLLPSALYRIDSKNFIAFNSSLRQMANISGISTQLANLFEHEFDLSVLQNNPVQNKNFSAIRMSWMEYGFTYARILSDKGAHRFKAGITPKLLQGLESSYFLLKDLNFLFTNKDTNSYLNADFTVAHSARTGAALDITGGLSDKFRQATPLNVGIDLGFTYEWHPITSESGKDAPTDNYVGRKTKTYKLKAGVSIVDLGKIKFRKEPNYYEMQLSIRQSDIIRYISAENVKMIDSLLRTDFPANTGQDHFSVLLPTAINTQLDYAFTQNIFLNLSTHMTGFYKDNFYKVRNYSAVCIAPRYETYWFDASLMLVWNSLSAKQSKPITPGINLRIGPLSLGSSDLSFLYNKSLSSLNFYGMLHLIIPNKKTDSRFTTVEEVRE